MAAKKRKVDAVIEAIDEAKAELDERERALEEREAALRKAIEGVDKEKQLMAGRKPSDVLKLNIGGTRYDVSRKTLCLYENSLLGAHFSGRWDDSIEKDSEGCFFIDQPIELMRPLLNFLRAKSIETTTMPAKAPFSTTTETDDTSQVDFYRLLVHYGMTYFVYPAQFVLHRGETTSVTMGSGPNPAVISTNWSTFLLKELHHERKIARFSIQLDGPTERAQIGWATPNYFAANVNATDVKGIGEEGASIALDVHRGGICFEGVNKVPVPGLALEAGTIITCEKSNHNFRWLVDGKEVAAVNVGDGNFGSWSSSYNCFKLGQPLSNSQYGYTFGAISCKGQWHVTEFSFF